MLLATAYADSREYRPAEIEFRRALELQPDSPPLVAGMVRALTRQGEFQKAIDELDAYRSRHATLTPPMLALQGDARLGLGEGDAKASYAAALEAAPGLPEAQLGMARLVAAERRTDEALGMIDDVLARSPGDVEALMLRGDVLHATSKLDEAGQAYRRALASRPDDTRPRLRLAALYIRTDKLDAARAELAAVKTAEPQNLAADYHLAALHMKEHHYGQARDAIQLVRARAPNHLASLQIAGAAAFHNDSIEQAERDLTSYLLRVPGDAYARKLLAANSLRAGNPDRALATIAPLLVDGTDAHVYAIAGEAALRSNQLARADAYLQKAASLAPRNAGVRALLGMNRLARGDGEGGIADLRSATALADDPAQAERLLVRAHVDRLEHDQALAVVAAMERQRPNDPSVPTLRAQVLLARGDVAAARRSLEAALALRPDHLPALNGLAELDVREENFAAARARFQALLDSDPKSAPAMIGLANVAGAARDEAAQLRWLEAAIAAAPGELQPRLLLTQHHVERREYRQALAAAREAYAARPGDADALALLAGTQFASGAKDEAITSYHTLVKRQPDSVAATYMLAQAYMALRQHAAARDALERVLELRPDHPQAQVALAMLEMQAGRHRAALRVAQRMRRRSPESPVAAALEGDVRMGQEDFAGAAAAYQDALATTRSSALYAKAHAALLRAGRSREAEAKAQEWLGALPEDSAGRLYLAAIAMEAGRSREAVGHYEAVLAREPDNFLALNNLAWLYQEARDPRALAIAEEAARLQPDDLRVADTLGWILVQRGDAQRGVALLRRAAGADGATAAMRYRLAAGYARLGDRARARETLDALLAAEAAFDERPEALALRRKL